MKNIIPFLLIPLTAFLVQCVTTEQADVPKGHQAQVPVAPEVEVNPEGGYSDITIPLLHSPSLEKRWGKPELAVNTDGSYSLHCLRKNAEFLIRGYHGRIDTDGPTVPPYNGLDWNKETGGLKSTKVPQKWETATVLGKPTHYYSVSFAFGDGGDKYSTVIFPVEQPGKPVASYELSCELNTHEISAESLFSTVKF